LLGCAGFAQQRRIQRCTRTARSESVAAASGDQQSQRTQGKIIDRLLYYEPAGNVALRASYFRSRKSAEFIGGLTNVQTVVSQKTGHLILAHNFGKY